MSALPDRFFRLEFARLVASLTRRYGDAHLQSAEDAAQAALSAAVESWPRDGEPDDPTAWLHTVAHRHLIDELRRRRRRALIVERHESASPTSANTPTDPALLGDVRDELLRMLFACADPALPLEASLALALKVSCGFDVREIALRTWSSEAAVYKRLLRARARLRAARFDFDAIGADELRARLSAVRRILYALFAEGHLSLRADATLRDELCDEALRLGHELAAHPLGADPESFALVALMHLHRARFPARIDGSGGLVLLEAQDRSLWDHAEVHAGLTWLARSAEGERFSRFHAEAGVAAEHCLAPSFAETRWDRIVACYEALEHAGASPLHRLNRALAVAEWRGARAGLEVLDAEAPPEWLLSSYAWSAVRADLHRRAGDHALAREYHAQALAAAPTHAVREALERRLTHG